MGAYVVGEIVNTELWIKECVNFVFGDLCEETVQSNESCFSVVMWLDQSSADRDPERESAG